MTTSSQFLPAAIADYLRAIGVREPAPLAALRAETATLAEAHYQIAPEEGQLLGFLARLIGARRALDIGAFTGYSALSLALAMGSEGRIVTLDVSEQFTAIARRHWQGAGVADRIDLRIGPATESLDRLITEGNASRFDLALVDADKENYDAYFEAAMVLVRAGGVIALDNTLWRGRVVDAADQRPKTVAFRELNRKLHTDPRIYPVVLPLGDGLTLALKL